MIDTVIVMAKECLPGRVKTRLTPPLSPQQAARVAAACLADTLELARAVPARRRLLSFTVLDAPPGAEGFEIVAQRGGGLDERIADALDHATGTTLVLGMDTPHAARDDLAPVIDAWPDDVDAWFGPAVDGGFWALALREPRGDLVRGVAMSRDDTGARQRARLDSAGLRVGTLATLTDIDTASDLHLVSQLTGARRLHAVLADAGIRTALAWSPLGVRA